MDCETCGNPIDRKDAERGSCAHCGAVLAHVLRAAEKAELVRRVVAQGNAVRIEGDSIEAAPPGPPREGLEGAIYEPRPMRFGVAASVGLALVAGLFAYSRVARRVDTAPTATPATPTIAEPPPPVVVPTPIPTEPRLPMSMASGKPPSASATKPTSSAAPAAARTVEDIVLSHKAQYDKCQRDELAQNPSAARRYTLAITVSPQGRAEWVELLSEGSSAMNACLQGVTRRLDFQKPALRSQRAIVTLTLAGTP
jgi:hypothetical protein